MYTEYVELELTCTQVDELDLTKGRATELLKAYEGDVIRAAKAFISPSIRG